MKQVLKALHQRPIAVYPIYIDLTGSIAGGLLLSQLLYWLEKVDREIWKTDAEIMAETRLTQTEFKNAKKIIASLPFMSVEKRGIPPKTYYSVNWDELHAAIDTLISSVTYQMNRRLSTSNRGGNLPNKQSVTDGVIHRLPSEISSETTSFVEKEFSTVLIDEVDETKVEVHHVPDYFDTEEKKERKSVAAKKKESAPPQIVVDVVNYLNEKTKQQFKPTTKETIQFINSRVNLDKWDLEDFKLVIDFKFSQWWNDEKMRQYLTPSTLFRNANAEKYIQAAKQWKEKPAAVKPGIVPIFRQENFVNPDRSKFKF